MAPNLSIKEIKSFGEVNEGISLARRGWIGIGLGPVVIGVPYGYASPDGNSTSSSYTPPSTPTILAIVLPILVGIPALALIIFCLCRYSNRRSKKRDQARRSRVQPSATAVTEPNPEVRVTDCDNADSNQDSSEDPPPKYELTSKSAIQDNAEPEVRSRNVVPGPDINSELPLPPPAAARRDTSERLSPSNFTIGSQVGDSVATTVVN